MSRKNNIQQAVRILAADACDAAIDAGKTHLNQNIGVVLVRIVVDGLNAEELGTLGNAIEQEVKDLCTTSHPETKHVDVASILVGAVEAEVHGGVNDLEQTVRAMLQASGAVSPEEIDEMVKMAQMAVGGPSGPEPEPVDLDEYLDGALSEVRRPLLGR